MAVERKYERDIDLLLAEEFATSPAFANWFSAHTKFSSIDVVFSDVYVSKSDNTGESDLVVVFEEARGNQRVALLIEDKIDAPLQPEQLKRYRLRGQAEVSRGDYNDFEIILCAPEAYRHAHPELVEFKPFVSYEAISEFLEKHDPSARGKYRANFIATAAKRNANTWIRIDDAATNAFWNAAYEIATREFPILEMKPLEVTKDSTWINFRPHDMPTRPQRVYVSFKGDRGYMDLTFTGAAAHGMSARIARLLDPDMTVHQTGKSAAIRLKVEGFKTSEPVKSALIRVRNAFAACERLIRFYRAHREVLNEAASEAVAPLVLGLRS